MYMEHAFSRIILLVFCIAKRKIAVNKPKACKRRGISSRARNYDKRGNQDKYNYTTASAKSQSKQSIIFGVISGEIDE